MRFIIHELEYEQPQAAGRLRYLQDGVPTGAVEAWRLTAAVDGYRFLRVDLDARDAPSGRSYLFHMVLNPEMRPEQLKYRVFAPGLLVSGALVWEKGEIAGTRTVNDVAVDEVVPRGAFWFPSVLGLSVLQWDPSAGAGNRPVSGATLCTQSEDPREMLALQATPVQLALEPVESEAGEPGTRLSVAWANELRELWLGQDGFPWRVARPDGLEAVATQFVAYHS